MKQSHGWMKWMSALVVVAGATACGVTVSEPIESANDAVSPLVATHLVKDISTSEAFDWCTWYVTTAWHNWGAAPAIAEVKQGFTCKGAFAGILCDETPTGLCAMRPSIEQCVQNLQRRPCEAPISELDACVVSVVPPNNGSGGSSPCGNDCAAFRARANCDQTIVQENQNQPTGNACTQFMSDLDNFFDCSLPVE